LERRRPSAERSAKARNERLSEREIKNALSTLFQPKGSWKLAQTFAEAGSQNVVSQRRTVKPGPRKAIQKRYLYGLKWISIGSVVSWSVFPHFQPRTANCADCASRGLPPFTSMDLTEPLEPTTTSSFTVPEIFIVRARAGYGGFPCGSSFLPPLGGSCPHE